MPQQVIINSAAVQQERWRIRLYVYSGKLILAAISLRRVKIDGSSAMILQKSQPAETGHKCLFSASAGPLKNMDASPPARKARAHEIYEKLTRISNTCELPWPVRGDMKKRLPTKPV